MKKKVKTIPLLQIANVEVSTSVHCIFSLDPTAPMWVSLLIMTRNMIFAGTREARLDFF